MAQDPDAEFLKAALNARVISKKQYAEALNILKIVRDTGVRTSAAAILLDKGFVKPRDLRKVEMRMSPPAGAGQGAEAAGGAAAGESPSDFSVNLESVELESLDDLEEAQAPSGRSAPAPEAEAAEASGQGGPGEEEGAGAGPEAAERRDPAAFRRHPRRQGPGLAFIVRRSVLIIVPVLALLGLALFFVKVVPAWHHGRLRRALREAEEQYQQNYPEAARSMYADTSRGFGEEAVLAAAAIEKIDRELREAKALYDKGEELGRQGNYREAVESFSRLLQAYPHSGRFVRWSARSLLKYKGQLIEHALSEGAELEKQLKWFEAADCYQKALRYDVGGTVAARLQVTGERVQSFENALAEAAKSAGAGDWAATSRAYQRALDICHANPRALDPMRAALDHLKPPDGMVLVRPGLAQVGADDADLDEKPARKEFQNRALFLDRTEVTNGEYAAFLKATGRPAPALWLEGKPPSGMEDYPVVCVSWDEASEYAKWCGKRLPTSLEWEAAARGGDGRRYPWGGEFKPQQANFGAGLLAAGASPADKSPVGCLDMGGNVSEWTADPYVRRAPAGPQPPRPGAPGARAPQQEEDLRVIRGGSWAGVEHDRPMRVLIGAASGQEPGRRVLVDDPSQPELTVEYPSQATFTFLSGSTGAPLFRYFMWIEPYQRWDFRSQKFSEGERLHFKVERFFRDARGNLKRHLVDFDTGFTIEKLVAEGDSHCVLVRTPTGGVQKMYPRPDPFFGKVPEAPARAGPEGGPPEGGPPAPEMPRPPGAAGGPAARLSKLSIAETARSSNLYFADRRARFVNVGFRCVKDL